MRTRMTKRVTDRVYSTKEPYVYIVAKYAYADEIAYNKSKPKGKSNPFKIN